MKKISAFFITFLLCISVLPAQQVQFTKGDWKEAFTSAQAENKYIFIDCYTEWCTWCKVMDKETFQDSQVVDFMNQQFVNLKLDMEQAAQAELGAKYRVRMFPTFLVFNPEGKLVYRIHGFRKATDLLQELNKALDPGQQMQFPGISENLNPGFPTIYMQQFGTDKRPAGMKKQETEAFLNAREDLFDEVSWAIISTFPLADSHADHFLNNIHTYRQKFGSEADLLFDQMMTLLIQDCIDTKNEHKLDSVLRLIDTYGAEDTDLYKKQIEKAFYLETRNWNKLMPILHVLWEEPKTDNNQINSDCWSLYENCPDENLLQQAMMRMQIVADEDPQYAYLDTHAALLFKLNQLEEAQRYAEMAITIGKANDEDVKETEALLAKILSAKK